jgi:hypothetical protein
VLIVSRQEDLQLRLAQAGYAEADGVPGEDAEPEEREHRRHEERDPPQAPAAGCLPDPAHVKTVGQDGGSAHLREVGDSRVHLVDVWYRVSKAHAFSPPEGCREHAA